MDSRPNLMFFILVQLCIMCGLVTGLKEKKGYNSVTHKCLALVCNGIGFMYFSIFTSLISLVFSTFKQPYNLLRSLTWKVGTNQADVDEHGNMTADVVVEQVIVRILMK